MTKVESLDALKQMRERLRSDMNIRENSNHPEDLPQIRISMGTCGIAAGARAVMTAVLEELAKRNIHDVAVLQTGCIGMCQKEPLLDIVRPGEDRVTYGPVSPTDVPRIIADHLINGVVVEDLVVAKIPNKEA